MTNINAPLGRLRGSWALIDLLTLIVYSVVTFAVLAALGIWWLFPILVAVLLGFQLLRRSWKRMLGRRRAAATTASEGSGGAAQHHQDSLDTPEN